LVHIAALPWLSPVCQYYGKRHFGKRAAMIASIIDSIVSFLMEILIPIIITLFHFICECCEESYNKHKPTEFFKIKEEINERYHLNDEYYEYFVISNPPKDTSLLKKTVEEYNFKTLPVDTIKKYRTYRIFYKETQCLTRNYEEGKPYPERQGCSDLWCFSCDFDHQGDDPGQQVRYHDLIFKMHYYFIPHNHSWVYWYRYGSKDRIEVEIKNIDLFYEENSKNVKE
jgi:hypothetical protein